MNFKFLEVAFISDALGKNCEKELNRYVIKVIEMTISFHCNFHI
jgi:hypothetical protein